MTASKVELSVSKYDYKSGAVFLFPDVNLKDNVKLFEKTCNDLGLHCYIDYLSTTQISYPMSVAEFNSFITTLTHRGFLIKQT